MTSRLNKHQIRELAQYFHAQHDRLKGVSSFYTLHTFDGVRVKAFTKSNPKGIDVWVAFPVNERDERLPIEVKS